MTVEDSFELVWMRTKIWMVLCLIAFFAAGLSVGAVVFNTRGIENSKCDDGFVSVLVENFDGSVEWHDTEATCNWKGVVDEE